MLVRDDAASPENISNISQAFLEARAHGKALPEFPGKQPHTLRTAYDIQRRSIGEWPDVVAGWKVGGIPPDYKNAFSETRLAGPIFRKHIHHIASGDEIDMPAFRGGFAAIEAEWIMSLGDTSAYPQSGASVLDVVKVIDEAFAGIEIASSPLRTINDLGPTVVISDFGNNAGLVIGPKIPLAMLASLEQHRVMVEIDGTLIGEACALAGLSGPLGAVDFLIRHLRKENIDIFPGTLVSTGAITGVHQADVGAASTVTFDQVGTLKVNLIPA